MIHQTSIRIVATTAQVEHVFQQLKMHCGACHKTLFYFDADGFHLKCNVCKQVTTLTWPEIQAKYQETHPTEQEGTA